MLCAVTAGMVACCRCRHWCLFKAGYTVCLSKKHTVKIGEAVWWADFISLERLLFSLSLIAPEVSWFWAFLQGTISPAIQAFWAALLDLGTKAVITQPPPGHSSTRPKRTRLKRCRGEHQMLYFQLSPSPEVAVPMADGCFHVECSFPTHSIPFKQPVWWAWSTPPVMFGISQVPLWHKASQESLPSKSLQFTW